jgi:hypothetical protein
MNKQCQASTGGLFSSKNCGNSTQFRCPACGKWVCQNHGIQFAAHFWAYELSGLLCSKNCQLVLFGHPALLKLYVEDEHGYSSLPALLLEWGLVINRLSERTNEFTINGRDVYLLNELGKKNVNQQDIRGALEFERRSR